MKLHQVFLAFLAICLCLYRAGPVNAQAPAPRKSQVDKNQQAGRLRENFDAGWKFLKGNCEEAQAVAFDDNGWRELDLPHDWSIEGPYNSNDPSGAPCGYLPCGIGWYRKTFRLGPQCEGKKVFVEFDGIYMNSDVWINGHHLGKRPYGYIGFQYDLTAYLNTDKDNVLAVRADNSLQPSSRWYTGSGIYRHVWLTVTDKLHVGYHGTYVQTPEISADRAKIIMQTRVQNDNDTSMAVTLVNTIVEGNGKNVSSKETDFEIAATQSFRCSQSLEIPKPHLWSTENPRLYTIRTEVRTGNRTVDTYETSFGVREIHFDSKEGFILNGEKVILKGVCNHHDLGPLGAALWDQALERRLRILKEMGCNSVRTAHNPSSPQLLDMCDRMGLLVINETFDEWREGWGQEDGRLVCGKGRQGKAKYGYHLYFDEWAQKDLTDHLLRDRNHPCVIMWSVGNEVPEAQVHGDRDTLKKLRDICHEIDPTRPVTVGCNQMSGVNESGFADLLETVGYNGGGGSCFQYQQDHELYPDRFIYASEVPHTYQTRSEYRTHSRYRDRSHQPANLTAQEVFPQTSPHYHSSYDNAGVRISARDSWRLTRDLPYVAGEFRWTGFDYLGESGGWPRVIGNFGIIDICNFPKDTYFFYQSQWTERPMVHLLPHWTWPDKEGTVIPVWCYTNCENVELFLNGKSQGVRTFTGDSDMHLSWDVPYQPGELKAVAMKDGKVICTTVTRTAGPPARITLTPDKNTLVSGRPDLSYVTIRLVDKEGNFDATADIPVTLELQGPARLLAVGNGDPLSHQSFQAHSIETFNGLCLAIISSTDKPGEIVLTAKSEGLAVGTVKLQSVVHKKNTSANQIVSKAVTLPEEKIDWPAFMQQHDMIFDTLPQNWTQAPHFGNAMIGSMLYQAGDTIRLQVFRADVQDHRDDTYGWTAYSRPRFMIGHFSLHPVGKLAGCSWRKDLWNAELTGVIQTDKGEIRLRHFTNADDMAIVTELTPSAGEKECNWTWHPVEARTTRGGYPTKESEIAAFARGYGEHYANTLKVFKANPPGRQEEKGNVSVWVQDLLAGGQYATAWSERVQKETRTHFVSIAKSYPESTAAETAVSDVKRFVELDMTNWIKAHRKWWHDYYPRSFVTIPDKGLESLYWQTIYRFGCTTRAGRCFVDTPGIWFQGRSWPYFTSDWNIQSAHWPVYAANRLEQGQELLNRFYDRREELIKAVRPVAWQEDSAYLPIELAGDLIGNRQQDMRYYDLVGNLPWAMHNLWWQYRYSMDDEMLREKIYPLLRRSINLYLHIVGEGDDGKLHLPPTYSPETGVWKDANFDLALFKWGCYTLLKASKRLGIDDPLIPRWETVVKRLGDYSVDEYGYMLGRDQSSSENHQHFSNLLMIYPLYLVNIEQASTADVLRRSFDRAFGTAGPGQRQAMVQAHAGLIGTAQGLGDEALESLKRLQGDLYPNGLWYESPCIESTLAVANIIQDMLIQSWSDPAADESGPIRIFPAVPSAWKDIEFRDLRTEGAFLVSAKRADGQTKWVRIKSLAGEPCRVRPDLDGEVRIKSDLKLKQVSPGIYEIDMKKGDEVLLY